MKKNVWHIPYSELQYEGSKCQELVIVDGNIWGVDVKIKRENRSDRCAKLFKASIENLKYDHKVIEIPIEVQAAFAIWSFDNEW